MGDRIRGLRGCEELKDSFNVLSKYSEWDVFSVHCAVVCTCIFSFVVLSLVRVDAPSQIVTSLTAGT